MFLADKRYLKFSSAKTIEEYFGKFSQPEANFPPTLIDSHELTELEVFQNLECKN